MTGLGVLVVILIIAALLRNRNKGSEARGGPATMGSAGKPDPKRIYFHRGVLLALRSLTDSVWTQRTEEAYCPTMHRFAARLFSKEEFPFLRECECRYSWNASEPWTRFETYYEFLFDGRGILRPSGLEWDFKISKEHAARELSQLPEAALFSRVAGHFWQLHQRESVAV